MNVATAVATLGDSMALQVSGGGGGAGGGCAFWKSTKICSNRVIFA